MASHSSSLYIDTKYLSSDLMDELIKELELEDKEYAKDNFCSQIIGNNVSIFIEDSGIEYDKIFSMAEIAVDFLLENNKENFFSISAHYLQMNADGEYKVIYSYDGKTLRTINKAKKIDDCVLECPRCHSYFWQQGDYSSEVFPEIGENGGFTCPRCHNKVSFDSYSNMFVAEATEEID